MNLFNNLKLGRSLKDKFIPGNDPLQNANSYTYLGLMFVPSGSLNQAIDTLCRKASKAMFKLRRSLNKLNVSPKLSLFLYDALIRPICTYAPEVWGSFIKAKHQAFNVNSDKYELFDKHCFEKLQLKFCKAILGVHKKASNVAVRGVLGRYPTIMYFLKQVLKNWFRITSYGQKQAILYNTYMCNLEIHYAKKCSWWFNARRR